MKIKDIIIKTRKRNINHDKVLELADSIKQIGLINPITVSEDGILIAGNHRLEAIKILKLEEIEANVLSVSDMDAELIEIDENLKRSELNDFELGRFLQRRNEILEAYGLRAKVGRKNKAEMISGLQKTTEDIANEIGISDRGLRQKIQIARDILPEVQKVIEETGNAKSTSALLEVARLPEEKQHEIAETLAEKGGKLSEIIKKPHVSNNSGNNEWYTPKVFIESARSVMGEINTDPASSEIANRNVQADCYFTEQQNGLDQKWVGNVWMNPPYSQPLITQFCEAISNRFKSGEIDQAIVLVNNATETGWFQTMLKECSAVCFPKTRIRFIDTDGNPSGAPLQGQAILYFGDNKNKFADEFSKYGAILYVYKG